MKDFLSSFSWQAVVIYGLFVAGIVTGCSYGCESLYEHLSPDMQANGFVNFVHKCSLYVTQVVYIGAKRTLQIIADFVEMLLELLVAAKENLKTIK